MATFHSALVGVQPPEEAIQRLEDSLKQHGEWSATMAEALPVMMGNDGQRKYAISKKYPGECARIEKLWWEQNSPKLHQQLDARFRERFRQLSAAELGILFTITILVMLIVKNLL